MKFLRRWMEQGKRARLLTQAYDLRGEGDLPGALNCYQEVHQENPDDLETLRQMAEIHAELGNTEQAVTLLRQLLAKDPDDVTFIAAAAFDEIREQEAFAEVYRTAAEGIRAQLEGEPSNAGLMMRLAHLHEMLNEPEEAHTLYRQVEENPEADAQATAHYSQARLYALSGEMGNAAAALQQAILLNPANLETAERDPALEGMRDTAEFRAIRQETLDRRIQSLRAAIDAGEEPERNYRLVLELLMAQSRLDEAVEAARDAMDLFPTELQFQEFLADALLAANRDEEARQAYEDILRVNANHLRAIAHSGVLYERAGNAAAAVESYADALRLVREDAPIAYLLARGFSRLGDAPSAMEALGVLAELAEASESLTPEELLARLDSEPDFASLRAGEDFKIFCEYLRGAIRQEDDRPMREEEPAE